MIIAVIGGPSSRGAVACELAKHLKYYLIDQEDIVPTLQDSVPSSSTKAPAARSETLSDLFFELALQIASTQLTSLNLGLVISLSVLPRHAQFDKLRQLSNSAGARLVIVQCGQPQDASGDDYQFEGVQKFTVDSTKTFVAEKFLAEMWGKVTARNSTHLHALSFYNNKPLTGSGTKLYCKRCQKLISGPRYQCIECDDYIFHKSCAENGDNLELVRRSFPNNLRASEPDYHFSPVKRCEICELNNKNFSDGCRDCLFETNMEAKFLPLIIRHDSHSHPLNLIMMPLSYNYKFGCCGCGEIGKSISYRCYDCNFNLHVSCVLLRSPAPSRSHQHTLTLMYDSLEETFWDKNSCYICNRERDPEQWFYYCSICQIVAHVVCCDVDQSS